MNHVKLLAVKCIASLIGLYLILGAGYGISFGNVFLITLILGAGSYIVGDMLILPKTNNYVASIADFGLSYIIIYWMSDALTVGGNLVFTSFIASIGVTVIEFYFHYYVETNLDFNEEERQKPARLQYQTETAEELYPEEDE